MDTHVQVFEIMVGLLFDNGWKVMASTPYYRRFGRDGRILVVSYDYYESRLSEFPAIFVLICKTGSYLIRRGQEYSVASQDEFMTRVMIMIK